jgi:hypothetical protein
MASFNLCTIRPRGFLHSSAFADVQSSLAWSLSALGHSVEQHENAFSASRATNIIFGAELLPEDTTLPAGTVIFNYEQSSHPRIGIVRKVAAANNCSVWDFSRRNLPAWADAGLTAIHVPVGWTPNLVRIPRAASQPIDVAFFGWMTPRRAAILSALRSAGLNVFSSDSCYGGARDEVLSRTKVALNVHHDGRDMFEIVRVSFLLANGKAVVTEHSSDGEDYHRDLSGMLDWWGYENLVQGCVDLTRSESTRHDLEYHAATRMRSLDYTPTVASALSATFPAQGATNDQHIPSHSRIGPDPRVAARFARASAEGDMSAFAGWLRDHARGEILEIGTRDGASTSAFLLGLESAGGHLHSVDIADCSGLFAGHPQWTFHHGPSDSFDFSPSTFDLILIDGDHHIAAYRRDLANAYLAVKPGGLILTHDCTPEPGHESYAIPIRAEFLRFAAEHGLRHEILPGRYGLGVLWKPTNGEARAE